MPHLHGKGPRQHVCGKCQEDIPTWEGVFCDQCAEWYHLKCDQLEINCLEAFRDLPEAPYLCRACRCDDKGAFLYTKSLERLHKGAKQGLDKLFMYVERERQFMKEDLAFTAARSPKYTADPQAESLLKEFYSGEKKSAAKVTRDGNSLFSAMSLALVGSEKLATELRVRCCIEMVVYDAFYRWQENFVNLARCAPDYTESCLNCATPGEHSCVWTLAALATVVRRCVKSLYPAVNGKLDMAVSILNTEFAPRSRLDDGDAIKILWAGTRKVDQTLGTWVPEAFVPLVDMPAATMSPVVVSPYLTPSRVSGRVRKPTAKVLAITNPKVKTEMKVVVQNTEEEEEGGEDGGDPDFTMPSDFTLEPTDEDVFQEKYRLEKVDLDWMDKYTKVAEGGKPLKGTAFLPAQEVFNELTTTEEVCPSIPMGRKEDVFFVVDNSRNLRYKHRRNYFQDDCGRYNQRSGTTCKSFYLLSPDSLLQQLIKDKGKYCKESRRVTASSASPTADSPRSTRGRGRGRGRGGGGGGGSGSERKVTKWIPMDPQPLEEDVVVLHRYYSSLEVDPTFKRRISWFSNLPSHLKMGHKSFLVEYITKPIAGLILPDTRKSSSYPDQGEATPEAAASAAGGGSDVEMVEDANTTADGSSSTNNVADQSSETGTSSQAEDADTTGREMDSESQPMDTDSHTNPQEDTAQACAQVQGGEAGQEETPTEVIPVEETPDEGRQEGAEEACLETGETEAHVIIIQQDADENPA